jgi:predicted acylesterase/phospholipase RssA
VTPFLVDLALQGGSHGALTWGVIERLLEETSEDRKYHRHVCRRKECSGPRLRRYGRRREGS